LGSPLVSVIVLNFNGKTYLGSLLLRCVSSVLRSDYPNLELIFFDNGSTDDTVTFVQKEFSSNEKFRIVNIPNNSNPPAANNKATEHAKGKYIFFLNNDVEIEPNSIRELVKAMESDSSVGIAMSKVMSFDRLRIQSVGALLDLRLIELPLGNGEEDKGQYDTVSQTTCPFGASMIVKKSLFKRIGCFDPKYRFYHDDIDLGLRARLAGFKVVCVPTSIVYHKGDATSSHTFNKNERFYDFQVSHFGIFVKNLQFRSMIKIWIPVFVNMTMDMYYQSTRCGANPFRVWFSILKNFRSDLEHRKVVQGKIRKIPDDKLFECFIGYSFFIEKIKMTFRNQRLVVAFQQDSHTCDKSSYLLQRTMTEFYQDHKL
jgi:GT2 family glycosyltransferase